MAETASKQERPEKGLASILADLPGVVRQFWSAVAFPLLELVITVFVLWYVLQPSLGPTVGTLTLLPTDKGPLANALDFYGLKAIIPFIVIVALLGLAQANSSILRLIGSFLPGKLRENSTSVFLANAHIGYIEDIWKRHPEINDVNALNAFLDIEIGRPEDAEPIRRVLSGSRWLQGRRWHYLQLAAYFKGLLAVVVIAALTSSFVFQHGPSWSRVFLCIIAISLLLAYASINRIRVERDYARQKVSDYLYYMQLKNDPAPGKAGSVLPEPDHYQFKNLRNIKERDQAKQWSLYFGFGTSTDDMIELLKAWGIPRPRSQAIDRPVRRKPPLHS